MTVLRWEVPSLLSPTKLSPMLTPAQENHTALDQLAQIEKRVASLDKHSQAMDGGVMCVLTQMLCLGACVCKSPFNAVGLTGACSCGGKDGCRV